MRLSIIAVSNLKGSGYFLSARAAVATGAVCKTANYRECKSHRALHICAGSLTERTLGYGLRNEGSIPSRRANSGAFLAPLKLYLGGIT